MSLVSYEPLFDFERLWNNLQPLKPGTPLKSGLLAPKVDITDHDNSYMITAELPGLKKDDIHLNLHNGILRLEAETQKDEKQEKDGKVICQERHYGKWVRSFNLGPDVSESDINAVFKDGILTLEIPRKIKAENEQKKIPIQS